VSYGMSSSVDFGCLGLCLNEESFHMRVCGLPGAPVVLLCVR
jgi:hypothetical protein